MANNSSRQQVAVQLVKKLSRARLVEILEKHLCIQCYDSESTETLRTALVENVVDKTMRLDALQSLVNEGT